MFFGAYLVKLMQLPYNNLPSAKPLTALAPADAFIGYMKVSLIAGLVFSSPWVFYHLWAFVASGLYEKEKKYVHMAVPFCAILFVSGALFFFFVVAPASLGFFLGFGKFVGIESYWTFQSYISFMTSLMLVFGLAFQTPIAIFFLNKIGMVSIQASLQCQKICFAGSFHCCAIATPPDVLSQITLAVPLYALFELGIMISRFSNHKKLAD